MDKIDKKYFHFKPSAALKRLNDDSELKTRGLDYFKVFFAPASGPRCFVTMGFDQQFAKLFASGSVKDTKWLVGASMGAVRISALIGTIISGKDLTSEVKEHFTQMYYKVGDTPASLSRMMSGLFEKCAPKDLVNDIVHHPQLHLAVMVTAIAPSYRKYPDWKLKVLFGAHFLVNIITQRLLGTLYNRLCFYSGPTPPPFMTDCPDIQFIPLTTENFFDVMRATTCIPCVSERCTYIEGAGEGLYMDGGISDFMLNVCIRDPTYSALLLNDLSEKVKQSFFDRYLPYRNTPNAFFENCSIIWPSYVFINSMVPKALPCSLDWFVGRYIKNPEERMYFWRNCYNVSVTKWPQSLANCYLPT